MKRFFIIPTLFFYCSLTLSAQFDAKIDLSWNDGNAIVEGRFMNLSSKNEQLTYQLKLQRKSKNGNNISNQQSGSFESKAQGENILALTEFNVTELDLYRIYLRVYRQGNLIAEDAIVNWPEATVNIQKNATPPVDKANNPDLNDKNIDPNRPKIKFADTKKYNNPQTLSKESLDRMAIAKADLAELRRKADAVRNKKNNSTKLEKDKITPSSPPNSPPPAPQKEIPKTEIKAPTLTPQSPTPNRTPDLEIDGLIIDETRTKIGRDYYEIFYNQWEAPRAAKNYTIRIKELPSRGRGAQIQVVVNDNVLIHRALQPRQEMIEDLANRSVSALANWLIRDAQKEKDIANESIY